MTRMKPFLMLFSALTMTSLSSAWAQTAPIGQQTNAPQTASFTATAAVADAKVDVPQSYVIGTGDVLGIQFWQQNDLSGDVVVRPDGRITVPLLNDVQAAGETPEQLSGQLRALATRFVKDPNVTVIVRQINSRAVFITGRVLHAGRYSLAGSTSVLQLIAMAGGLAEWADAENITVMRMENNQLVAHRFNYKDVIARKHLAQNIELKPGDTVIVP
jgi:polysaccharide export outer membrane protein